MKRIRIIWVLPLLLLWSCEFQSYEEYGIKAYDGAFTFTELTKKAEWKNRFDHAAVAFDGKMWIFGGYNPGEVRGDTYYEDVWSSSDGVTWDLLADDAPWKGRRGHTVNVFDDGTGEAMYLIGGFEVDEETGYRQYTNDVWRSDNGVNWIQIKERNYPEIDSLDEFQQRVSPPIDTLDDWFPRMNHATVIATHNDTNYIYLIGGRTQLINHQGRYANKYFNDVWRSTDGIDWNRVANNDYGIRASHAAAVDPTSGKIYIQGGEHGLIFESEYNTTRPIDNWTWLWSSEDGENWVPANDTATFEQRYLGRSEHQIVFFNNTLWGFPGKTDSNVHYHLAQYYHYPTWRLDNGNLWSVDSEGSDMRGRHSYATVIYNHKIWFLGGFTSNNGQNNDVWSAEL